MTGPTFVFDALLLLWWLLVVVRLICSNECNSLAERKWTVCCFVFLSAENPRELVVRVVLEAVSHWASGKQTCH